MGSDSLHSVTEVLGDDSREVTAYVPGEQVDGVVFVVDGQWHAQRLAEALGGDNSSTMIVGVAGQASDDERLRECVFGIAPNRFEAHERAFIAATQWAAERLGRSLPTERTAIWGASLGGEFALAMGLRHPEAYGSVVVASPGAGFRPPEDLSGWRPQVSLVAGRQEPFFLDNAMRWAEALRAVDADVEMTACDGEHGDAFWFAEFPRMVADSFGAHD